MTSQDYSVQIEEVPPGGVVVKLGGVLGMEAAGPLGRELTNAISTRSSLIVVDMSRVTFISSTSLGVLIGLHKRMMLQGGGKLRMAALPAPIDRMMRSLCLHQAVELFPSVTEALVSE
jgi:anti-anti-sigma factor